MYFSNYFNVDKKKIQEYGAVDISLVLDLPLFIDPILIYSSEKKEYNELYNYIIKFTHSISPFHNKKIIL